jgi:CubicO group peptidase (beta-lactamase class C family)
MIRLCGVCIGLAWLFLAAFGRAQQSPAAQKPDVAAVRATDKADAAAVVPARHALEHADLEAFFDGIIPLQLERSDVAGASVLVMKDGKELLKKGYGFSDMTKKKAVDPETTMFRLASISKLFTWISVMQLAERGKLDIDSDVNKYLDFRIVPAFGKPVTLRNLMTHTGGFEEVIRDILLTDPRKATPLREYLIANQPRRMYPPGEVPAYSNYGVGLAGYVVQRVSGQPFEQYVTEHIFQPLGMKHSSFHQPLPGELLPLVSGGYENSTEKPAIGFEIFNPAPAGGVSSAASDMGRLAQALLNGGELDGSRILKAETLKAMWTRQFAASDKLPAMCMGFYQTWRNELRFVGHDGDLIAFHSMFLLEPKEKLVLFISYNSAGSASRTRRELLRGFADRYYPGTSVPEFQKFPIEELKAIEGTYQSTRRSDSTKIKLANLTSQSHASVGKDGVLKMDLARDLRGHVLKWKPIGKDLWQVEDDQNRILAIRDASGKIVRLAVPFAGAQVERVPWYENGKLVLPLLAGSLLCLLAVVAASIGRFVRRTLLRKRPPLKEQPGTIWLTTGPRSSAFSWMILAIGTGVLMYVLENRTMPPDHTVDKYFSLMNWAAGIAIFLSIFAVVAGVRVWRRAEIRLISQTKFSLVALACLFLTWFAIHWNLIGPAHRF